jgi:hypothetical protein
MATDQAKAPQALQAIDFATFVLSLASNALVHLGELPEPDAPEGAPPQRNLPMAKQTIDILAMLEAKTKGNLDEGERQLLESVLYDLRVKYVDASKKK